MPASAPEYFLERRLFTPRETPAERQARERRSLVVAREMLGNGVDANTVLRYTGLTEERLRAGA